MRWERSEPPTAYDANVSAIAAQDAVFPITNPQPAPKPPPAPSRSRPYTYVPPDVGYCAASWADATALQYATPAARASPIRSPLPAAFAAGPKAAKTPAPIIE